MNKLKTVEIINELFNINHELIEKFKQYMELRNIKEVEGSTKYSRMNDLSQVKLIKLN